MKKLLCLFALFASLLQAETVALNLNSEIKIVSADFSLGAAVYLATPPTLSDKQWAPVTLTSDGSIRMFVTGGSTTTTATTGTLTSGTYTSASGNIATGIKEIVAVTSSDFSGTINGLPLTGAASLRLAPAPGTLYPAIPYTRSAGTIYTSELR